MTLDVAVVGGGPSGLMAAEVLARAGATVVIYDRMPSVGRKFLMAGRGGLNLTHSEAFDAFLDRYVPCPPQLEAALRAWPPEALRQWCHDLGQETFVGSSGRVFPKAMKASPLLRAWLGRLAANGVTIRPRHRWCGWTHEGDLLFTTPEGIVTVRPRATVLALGGASWPNLGSDGRWAGFLADEGIALAPFRPANCGVNVPWSPVFRARYEGLPIKGVALGFGHHRARGDLVVTAKGLEGGALYPLAAPVRDALDAGGEVVLQIALRPDLSHEHIASRLARRRPGDSLASALKRTLHLAPVAIGLLQEGAHAEGSPLSNLSVEALARRINALPLRVAATAGLDRAISTAGGVTFAALDEHLMLRQRPGTFGAGEMLDWEAPTGGYLLQASFATGVAAAHGVLRWSGLNPG